METDAATTSGTLHAGAGLTYRRGRFRIFGEARRYLFGNDNPRALRGAMPVTLGVRF